MKIQEQVPADSLRAKTINHMLSNNENFHHLSAAVNSDMPSSVAFCFLEDRILHMANPTSPVGEMEISALSEVLQQPIHIINAETGSVVKYKEGSFPLAQPVSLLYSPHGDNAGHYDCAAESAVSVALISPACNVAPKKLAKRKARKTEAEIVTSSPYKRKLELSQAKGKQTKKKNKARPNTDKKDKDSTKTKRVRNVNHQDKADWFCFLCQECTREDMIQCLMC